MLKCNNIKELDLHWTNVTGKNLIQIAKLFNKIQSIDFRHLKIQVGQHEMDEFSKLIGPQLIKCDFGHQYTDFMKVLIKQMKIIEDLSFTLSRNTPNKELFHHFNVECNHLKVLYWGSHLHENHFNYQDEEFINVMQRINHLKIHLPTLSYLKFNLDNLTELTIFGNVSYSVINTTFVNVIKLNIIWSMDLDALVNVKFPKLESFTYNNYKMVPLSFIEKMKNIKTFHYYDDPLSFRQSNQLANFVLNQIRIKNDVSNLYESFDVLEKHKSLQNIKFTIHDFNMKIGNQFYDKLIRLC